MLSKVTLAGLHNYGIQANDDLWEYLLLPVGIDKEIIVNEILRQGSTFPLLWPDYGMLKRQIDMWSKKWYHNFDRWITAYLFEYNALFNLDVTSTTSESGKNSGNTSISENINRNASNTGSSSGTNGNTDTTSKSAYDASTFQNTEKVESSGSSSLSSSGSSEEETTRGETRNIGGSHESFIKEIRQGNQGVTMSQEMLLAEFNAWKWNIYDHIASIFVNEMCIMIYE